MQVNGYKIAVSPAPKSAKRKEVELPEEHAVLDGMERAALGFAGLFGLIAIVALMAFICGGCALERADPAARSSRATYGAISLVASGDNAQCSLTIGDGALTAADGEGAITQPSTQTTTQNPDLSGAVSPVAAGIHAAAQIGAKAIDAYAAKKAADGKAADAAKAAAESAAASAKAAQEAADAAKCADGSCDYCEDGSCDYTE